MAADGSNQAIVTKEGGDYPTWSPDGRRIAFSDRDLYVVDAQGGKRQLLADPAGCRSNALSWSPEGDKIAFECIRTDSPGHLELITDSSIYIVWAKP